MQLKKTEPFSTQVRTLKGEEFEEVVAASLFYAGYYVERNLIFGIKKETIAEIDVVASLLTPLNEIRIAIECKGAKPNFNDLRKFSTLRPILSGNNYFVEMFLFGANSTREEHIALAEKLDIKLLQKDDISKFVLPILWGSGDLIEDRVSWINRYLAMNRIETYYTKKVIDSIQDKEVRKLLTGYKKYLYSDLWSISDPVAQINDCFEKAQKEFYGFTGKIAGKLGTTLERELSNPENEVVQAAMFLELKHRIMNLFGIARCTIVAKSKQGRDIITERTPLVQDTLNNLCDYNVDPNKFINFVTRFIFLWGGIFTNESVDNELQLLADETGISQEQAESFYKTVKKLYNSGSGLFYESKDNTKVFMKFIPASIRALGLIHRKSIITNFNRPLFREDDKNLLMLDKVFEDIDGHIGLDF